MFGKTFITVASAIAVLAAASVASAKDFTVGLSQESLDHPWLAKQKTQVQAACKAAGVRLLATDGQGQVPKQIAGIEDMVSQGIDVLLVQAGKAEGLRQALEGLKAKKIPYIFVGKPIHNAGAVSMVSMDNGLIGKQIGQFIVDHLKETKGAPKGNVVLIEGIPGDETSVLRIGGAFEVLKAYPDIKIVARQPADYRRPQAVTVMQNILQANPKGSIDAVFAANDEMALGVVQATRDAGRIGEFTNRGPRRAEGGL